MGAIRQNRAIVHLDADAFFASVEQAADPRLRGKPVAVGGEKRGVVAAASYEARRMGVASAMPTRRARRLCPGLIVLPGDYEKYEQFSHWMFSYARDFTPEVEITSIDEGYFDLSGICKPPEEVAQTIRGAIRQSLKINVSEGIAGNKLVSQIASKLHKPAAFSRVATGHEASYLRPLANRWLPGIGPKAAGRLDSAGLLRIGQVAGTETDLLQLLLGDQASTIREFARGIDNRPVSPRRTPAQSFSKQRTFEKDITDEEYAVAALQRMADELMARVRAAGKQIRTLTVRVRYNDMAEDRAGASMPEPTDLETDLYGRLRGLLARAWRRRVSLRLLSLKFSNVYDEWFRSELPLDRQAQTAGARRELAKLVDELRRTRGPRIILRGHDFRLCRPPEDDCGERRRKQNTGGANRDRRSRPTKRRVANPVPLGVRSYYSFLNSTLSPAAIVQWAVANGVPAVGLADQGNLHGAPEFARRAKAAGIQPVIGAEARAGGHAVQLYVSNARGYANLCQLLTLASGKNVPLETLAEHTGGLLAVGRDDRLVGLFGDRFYRAVMSPRRLAQLGAGERNRAVPAIPVHYATPEERWKFDIVQSIRTLTLLRQQHPDKLPVHGFHFRTPKEMRVAFAAHPDALARPLELAGRCAEFEFPFGPPQFPAFEPPNGFTSRDFLRQLALAGLRERYDNQAAKRQAHVEEELGIIAEVGYEDYFLITWDLLRECRRRGIPWITRGSAADSLVCYCLGISDVCPARFRLYFRRFLNRDRMRMNKLPDIDIDFPHDRKDDVVEWLLEKYGPEHAAVVGGFSTYQARSAMGDVAKVLGMSEFQVRRITDRFPWHNPECRDLPLDEEPCRTALEMTQFLDGFPHHPKMHPCGVVLSRQPLHELTPTFVTNKGWPATHFDMDAVEAVGLVKMDILAQGGLSVLRDTKAALARRGVAVDPQAVNSWDDPQVWKMIAGGGARAVHHIESPAMVNLCRMANVRDIDGLVAVVSVIRPGAANEQKKQRFALCYQGMEPITYPHPSLEPVLRDAWGQVIYEEHILQICERFSGLEAGRADQLRRALGKHHAGVIEEIRLDFFAGARALGRPASAIEQTWEMVEGFAGYAFCKAHSAAYGVEAHEAAWMKRYYPVEFMAAVLTHGKGFYDPLVYVLESLRLGIPMRSPCVNEPGPGFTAMGRAIRVPATRTKGLTGRTIQRMIGERQRGRFDSLADFHRRVQPQAGEMESLIRVGAFDTFGRVRTTQFWEAQILRQRFAGAAGQDWLLPPLDTGRRPVVPLDEPTPIQRLDWENELLGFPVSGHPLERWRHVDWASYCPVEKLNNHLGQRVTLCGLVVEQRIHQQVTGEPMKFLTLCDWTGMVETEMFAGTYRYHGLATARYSVLEIEANIEPFENDNGFSLRIHRAGKPRSR